MKKSTLFFNSFILFLSLAVQNINAQDSTATRKIKAFSQHYVAFSKSYPPEKVYLHFDNTAYYLGESIWFKAYATRADRNSLSNISKVLYVELLNAEGYVIETKKLKLENGQCHGDFKLNPSNYGGFYELRAYTLYMLNFGPKNYFSRVFPVYDTPKNPSEYIPLITDRPNSQRIPKIRTDYSQKGSLVLNFFPEGGNLVAGVNSKVAFKATGKNGDDVIILGGIYNDKDEKLADVNTGYQGMGAFEFTPGVGKYIAKVSSQNSVYQFELPAAMPVGTTMNIDNSDEDKINILIQKNAITKAEPLGLSISCRGALYAFEEVNLDTTNAIVFKYPKKLLPSGVIQITLYNASGEILSERLAFVNHQSQMKINASQNKTSYQPYEKVNMAFLLNDSRNNPIETTFSVSVRDGATSSNHPFTNNILTDLLLSSELNGYIENPGFYFQADDNTHRQALDLLLLTQGWCRYSWKQMAGVIPFVIKHTIEKGLVLDGNVASVLLKKKMNNVSVSMIMLSDSTSQQGKCKTDSVGNFNFALQDFKGDGKLILQPKVKDKRKDTRIMLNRQYSPDLKTYSFPELNTTQYFKVVKDTTLTLNGNTIDSTDLYSPKNNSKLSMDKKNHVLKEVVVREKWIPMKVSLKYDVVKEMDRMEDTGEWQPADIYGFLVKTNKYVATSAEPDGSIRISYKGKNIRFVRRDSKTFATEVGDDYTGTSGSANDISGASKGRMPLIDEIESISIVEDYSTIMRVLGGSMVDPDKTVLAVMILKKNFQKEPNGIRNTTFSGYSNVKEFFSPRYNRVRLPNDKDYRRTLYWNPDVKTNKDGKADIIFYNNDACNIMNISAETVTENGIIGALNK